MVRVELTFLRGDNEIVRCFDGFLTFRAADSFVSELRDAVAEFGVSIGRYKISRTDVEV